MEDAGGGGGGATDGGNGGATGGGGGGGATGGGGSVQQAASAETAQAEAYRRGHSARKHAARKRRAREGAAAALIAAGAFEPPEGASRTLPAAALPPGDWEAAPAAADPGRGGGLANARAAKKRAQVLSFCAALAPLLEAAEARSRDAGSGGGGGRDGARASESTYRPTVVEFGAGSGNLVLALAHRFPVADFVAVEMKARSLELLLARAREAGLANVRGCQGMIESYGERFDVAVALHACGNATDYAMLQAARHGAAYVVAPCCIGKLKYSLSGGSSFSDTRRDYCGDAGSGATMLPPVHHPRSEWLRTMPLEAFAAVAKLADCGESMADSAGGDSTNGDGALPLPRRCKLAVERDRQEAMRDVGYSTLSFLMDDGVQGALSAMPNKADMLVGALAAGDAHAAEALNALERLLADAPAVPAAVDGAPAGGSAAPARPARRPRLAA